MSGSLCVTFQLNMKKHLQYFRVKRPFRRKRCTRGQDKNDDMICIHHGEIDMYCFIMINAGLKGFFMISLSDKKIKYNYIMLYFFNQTMIS